MVAAIARVGRELPQEQGPLLVVHPQRAAVLLAEQHRGAAQGREVAQVDEHPVPDQTFSKS